MPTFEAAQSKGDGAEEWSPSPKEREWGVDAFAVDWPLNGDEERFAHEMEQATLEALRNWGKVDHFRVVFSQSSKAAQNEGRFFPRIYTLERRSREWFVRNGYFKIDDEAGIITPTKKWLERFFSRD